MATDLASQFEKQKFGYIDKFVSSELAHRIFHEAKEMQLTPGEVSSEAGYWQTERKADRRGDHIGWVDVDNISKESGMAQLIREIDSCVDDLRKTCSTITDIETKKEGTLTCDRLMVAKYKDVGSRFVPHIDNPNNNGRVLTFTYYINPEYDSGSGAELCIRSSINGPPIAKIDPSFNRLACIDSEHTVHEVLPLKNGERWALVIWYSLQSREEKLEAMRAIFKLMMGSKK